MDDEFRMDEHIASLDAAQALECAQRSDFKESAPCLAENLDWSTLYGGRWKKERSTSITLSPVLVSGQSDISPHTLSDISSWAITSRRSVAS